MSFTFICGSCGKSLETEEKYAGQQVQCPLCNTLITIPAPQNTDKTQMVNDRKKQVIDMIHFGRYAQAFAYAQRSDCTQEDILEFLLEISYREHAFDVALEYAEQLIALHPNSSVGYRWKANMLDDGFGKMEESIRLSTKAIELNPQDARAYVIRGNTKRWMKQPDLKGAQDDYNAALAIDENCGSAYSGLGMLGLEAVRKIRKNHRNTPGALKQITDVENLFKRAIEVAGGDTCSNYGAYQGMAQLLILKERPVTEIMPYLNKSIAIAPNFPYHYVDRVEAHLNLHEQHPNKYLLLPWETMLHDVTKAIAATQDFSNVPKDWLNVLHYLLEKEDCYDL